MNMVMTFVLHPLSHYNSIIEPRAWFLISLIEGLTIYFPSHFILSIIDVYRDTTTHDKLIFPSTIMQLLRHFEVCFPSFDPFPVMGAIDADTVKCSEAFWCSSSSNSFCSIHIHSLLFYEQSDTRGHHGATSAHECSP